MHRTLRWWLIGLSLFLEISSRAELIPQTLNTSREFPRIESRALWEDRARQIRLQALASCGLWPLPERTPLRPRIYGRLERDGYSVEKVIIETTPGFYLAGNLYRPPGRAGGSHPGVLIALGHWEEGHLVDTDVSSAPALGASFARQGMIAFAYDMLGYNDTRFADSPADQPFGAEHARFLGAPTNQLWNINVMGLQTWNSIRALDFLASLPGVDKRRLGCTGASGGGTQTFMLGLVDDRLAVQAPVCMVSHSMQGGCGCENSPGLRVEFSNMEIAAAAAPRPQILVAATGDWTRTMTEVEGPAVARIYGLVGRPEALRFVRFDFGHNYNQTSREAVYEWFGQWLLKQPDPALLKERPHQKERAEDLRIGPKDALPADAMTSAQYIQAQEQRHRAVWENLIPRRRSEFEKFKTVMAPLWEHTVLVNPITLDTSSSRQPLAAGAVPGAATAWGLQIQHSTGTRTVGAWNAEPRTWASGKLRAKVVFAGGDADSARVQAGARSFLEAGLAVIAVTNYSTTAATNQFANFFTVYNRTKVQERVRDLMALSDGVRFQTETERGGSFQLPQPTRVVLCGEGTAGVWALLAAPAADAVVVDGGGLAENGDESLLDADHFCPGLRNIGTFEGAAMLAAPHPLLIHNAGARSPGAALQATYRTLGAEKYLRIESRKLSPREIAEWIAGL